MTRRIEQVESLLTREVARRLTRELAASRTPLFAVTRVRVSPDLSVADVYLLPVDPAVPPGTVLNGVKRALPRVQREIAAELTMRRAPRLRVRIDAGQQHADRIDELLAQVKREREERGR